MPRRSGGYAAVRFSQNQVATQPHNVGYVDVTCIGIDSTGTETGVLGQIQNNGLYPDTNSMLKFRELLPEDNQGNFWLLTRCGFADLFQNWYEQKTRTYLTRLTGTGLAHVVLPDSFVMARILSIEVLPGGIRLVGRFWVGDSAFSHVYNELVTDAQGRFSAQATVKRWTLPDAYAGRGYLSQMQLVERLPDGKLIGFAYKPTASGVFFYTSYPGYYMRFYADGRFDPTYLPVYGNCIYNAPGPACRSLGNRLYWADAWPPSGNPDYRSSAYYIDSTLRKNNLYATTLANRVATKGYVEGRISQVPSPQVGCAPAGPLRHASGMVVVADETRALSLTDTAGFYTMATDTGRITVRQLLANDFLQRQVCPAAPNLNYAVHIDRFGATSQNNDFINQTYDCPRLAILSPGSRFRLCSRGALSLVYLNDGTAAEPAARLRLSLPREVRVLSANKPFVVDADSSLVFDLGALRPGARGILTIQDTVGCIAAPDSATRACFSARLEPMALCGNIDPAAIGWSGAWLDGEARYQAAQGLVRIVIRNRGAAMADSVPYTLANPAGGSFSRRLLLAAGDSLALQTPPTLSGNILFTVQQPAACPLGSASQLTHAGVGSARKFLAFGAGLWEAYSIQACPEFRYSFDPNEKTAEPSGAIEPGTRLTYTIHFENKGNDTAYAVTVSDTLPAGLDPASFKMGGSSHPCTPMLDGTSDAAVITFYFTGIKLAPPGGPDSAANNGSLSFSISTRPTVARGSVVANRAAIYFDGNLPVMTGYTHNPIADLRVTAVSGKPGIRAMIRLWPNPAHRSCRIQVDGAEGRHVQVHTIQGRLAGTYQLAGAASEVLVEGLAPGVYTVSSPGLQAQRLIVIQ